MKIIRPVNNPDITITNVKVIWFRQRTNPFIHRGFYNEDFRLVFVKSGSILYTSGTEELIIRPGDLLLLKKYETYSVTNNTYEPDNTPYEFYCIQFEIAGEEIPLLNRITPIQHYDIALKQFHKLYECMEEGMLDYKINSKAILYQILLQAYKEHNSTIKLSPVQKNLDKAKLFIDGHYMDRITVNAAKLVSGYSLSHFSRLFQQYYGMSPIDYITMVRLEKAKAMLLSGLFNLDEIAEACGFSNEYYFSRVFKKSIGCSPKKYSSVKEKNEANNQS